MLNILLPLGAQSVFFESADYPFPKPLAEVNGLPMIQRVVENLSTISGEKRFIFILREEDCARYHLDSTVRLLAGNNCIVIKLHHQTMGAACSALLAVDHIGGDDPLIIVNGDQIFDCSLDELISRFRELGSDAGCLTFDSIHPRWSYVRLEGEHNIVETAEKHPISRNAIGGFYYFARGSEFVEAAQNSIRHGASVDNAYYIAPVLNELILLRRKVTALRIQNSQYHTFYSPKKIEDYESCQSK